MTQIISLHNLNKLTESKNIFTQAKSSLTKATPDSDDPINRRQIVSNILFFDKDPQKTSAHKNIKSMQNINFGAGKTRDFSQPRHIPRSRMDMSPENRKKRIKNWKINSVSSLKKPGYVQTTLSARDLSQRLNRPKKSGLSRLFQNPINSMKRLLGFKGDEAKVPSGKINEVSSTCMSGEIFKKIGSSIRRSFKGSSWRKVGSGGYVFLF